MQLSRSDALANRVKTTSGMGGIYRPELGVPLADRL